MRAGRVNMTENIREALEEMILRGNFRTGEQLASNAELAARFGVSTLTADRAVRLLVDKGLVYRKHGVGTFVGSPEQREQKQKYRIVVADRKFPATPAWESAMGIRTRISIQNFYMKNCDVKLIDYPTVCDFELFQKELTGIDGLLITSGFVDPVTVKNLKQLEIPIVITHLEDELELPFHQIMFNNRRGIDEAVERVLVQDPAEILIVYESHANGQCRKEIFEKSLIAAGYPAKQICSHCVETDALVNAIPSYRLGLKLSSKVQGKFIFSTSDVVSFSLLEAFRENSLEAGRDFQLLSYDNLEDYGYLPFAEPCLTSIDAPKTRLAERSADLLLDQIEKGADESVVVRIPTRLVIRKSAFRV
ncbi:MAG: GntR family transcriptional regulator [Lentisphaerae bacterium]|nr:GntR family transcriptional regulator [Lentisphaerota bacterium]